MNSRSTLALVVLAVVLALVVWFGVVQAPPGSNPGAPTGVPFPTPVPPLFAGVQAEQVNALRATQPLSHTAFALARDASGTWNITEAPTSTLPLPTAADPNQVTSVVSQIAGLMPSRVFTQDLDLQAMGLSQPGMVVTFTATSGITGTVRHELRLGNEPLAGSGFYAQKDDDPNVYIVSSGLVGTLAGYFARPPLQPTPTPTPVITTTGTITVSVTGTVLPAVTIPPPAPTVASTP